MPTNPMPTNPHYEAVRTKVIAACPELMEISFGAKLHRHNERFGDYSVYYVLTYAGQGRPEGQVWISSIPFGSITINISKDEIKNGGEFEIIGHPIHLNHILRALNNSSAKRILLHGDGQLDVEFENKDFTDTFILGTDWDLTKDDLAEQDPSVWEALDKMLSV